MKLTKKPYIKKPLLFGLISVLIIFSISFFYDCTSLKKITNSINDTATSFSLTFIAFSITALALLSFVQNQDWFKKIAKSVYFVSFIDRFFFSTKGSIVLFFSVILIKFLDPFYSKWVCISLLSFLIFSLVFLTVWTWNCLDDLIEIFKE